jgi:hypothetical protein
VNGRPAKDRGFVNRAFFALVALFVVGSTLGQSPEPAKIRITTWNLEWFPNGSAHEAPQEKQAQRIAATADVLKRLNPDILLLQEMRDYDACARLGEAIQPGAYQVAICSAFKGAKQQEAIVAKRLETFDAPFTYHEFMITASASHSLTRFSSAHAQPLARLGLEGLRSVVGRVERL